MEPRVDFVNFFAASTPEWISCNSNRLELSSGFLARFLLVYAEPSDKCFPFRQLANAMLEKEIHGNLRALIDTEATEISLSDSANSNSLSS